MKYRISIGNIFFVLVFCIYLYTYLTPNDARYSLGIAYLFMLSIAVLVVDFFLQLLLSNYKTLLIFEAIGLAMIFLILKIS